MRHTVIKLAGAIALALGLTGCIDATTEIEITSETTAKASLTQVMSADFYAMAKMGAAQAQDADSMAGISTDFCADGTLTELPDGGARCDLVSEGSFDQLRLGEDFDGDSLEFSSAGPGLVRVSFPAASLKSDVGGDQELDAETQQMMTAFFEGHTLTLRIKGREVVESNLEISADRTSAERVIPLLDLINATADLPDEFFAIVRAN